MGMTKNRRKFLKTASSSALFATLGSSFFTSCYEKDEDISPVNDDDKNEDGWANGYNIDSTNIKIDLNHNNFKILKGTGGWKRFDEGALLLVNVGSDIIRAFSSICPHAQCRTSWAYANNNFTCTCHDSIFKNDGSFVSGPAAGQDLKSLTAKVEDNILTVTED